MKNKGEIMMKKIEQEDCRKILIDVLNEMVKICNENNLRYYLAYGTLIGAIRHKGFIPWDDDIDLWMPRPDYDRFVEIMQKYKGKYRVLTALNDKEYNYPFAKVVDTETYVKEYENTDIRNLGVYVDIFPLDGLGNDYKSALDIIRSLNVKCWRVWQLYTVNFKNNGIKDTILKIIGKKNLFRSFIRACKKCSYDESELVGMPCYRDNDIKIFERSYFDKTTTAFFEGCEYNVPLEYDKVLKNVYGDYMQLPPENERKSLHIMDAFYR